MRKNIKLPNFLLVSGHKNYTVVVNIFCNVYKFEFRFFYINYVVQ